MNRESLIDVIVSIDARQVCLLIQYAASAIQRFSVVPSLDHGNGNSGQDSATTLFQPANPLR
jgi:hypothetical protein